MVLLNFRIYIAHILKLVESEHHCLTQLFDFCLQGDSVGNSTHTGSKSLKIPVI